MFRRKQNKKPTKESHITPKQQKDFLNPLKPIYMTLFDSMIDGVVVQDHKGKIIYSNQVAQKILQLPDDKLKGKTSLSPIWQNIHEDGTDFPGETHPAMVALKTGKPVKNVIMGLSTPNIKTKWLRVNASPIIDENKVSCVVATFADITNEKTRSIELENLYSKSKDFLGVADTDGYWKQVNSEFARAVGYDEQYLISHPFLSFIHKDDIEATNKEVAKLTKGIKTIDFVNRYRKKNGEYLSIQWNATPLGSKLYCIGRDISDKIEQMQRDKQHNAILQFATDAIYSVDVDCKLLSWNKAAEKLYGYSEEEIIGKSIQIIIPKDHNDLNTLFNIIKKGKNVERYETKRQRKNGSTVDVALSVSPNFDLKRNIIGASIFARNISIEKRQLKELTDLKDRFAFATESAKIGVWEWDIKTNALIWDDRMYRLYGISSRDFSGAYDAWVKGLYPDDKKRSMIEINKAIDDGKIFNSSFRVMWPNGTLRYIRAYGKPIKDESGKVTKMVGVNWDETDDIDNIKSIERFKLAVDAAYDHVIICDKNGKIIYANNSASKTTGYTKEEMLGNTPSLWGGQMPKEFYKDMWHTIATLKKPFIGEVNNIRKSGEIYIAEAHISPILDETGKIVEFYLGIERDITLIKDIDKSKTEFVSLASHQLRTPLSAVNWYVELLQDEATGKLNKTQKEYINEIYTGNQRMVTLVNSLLNISRLEMGTFDISPKIIDPSSMVEVVLKELEQQIEHNSLTIINNSKKQITKYNADPELFTILAQNLLSNAVKYTPGKGTVSFSMDIISDKFVFTVSDTGRGIPSHQKDKIFTKLFRADNVRELEVGGTGLGLYIVKSIVEQAGGTISFTSNLNKGSTFVIKLPKIGMHKKLGTKDLN